VVGLFVFYQLTVVSKGIIRGLPERRRGRRDPLFDVPNFHDMLTGRRTRQGLLRSRRSVKKESSMSGHSQGEFRSHKRPITDRRVLLYKAAVQPSIFTRQPECLLVLVVLPFPSLALALALLPAAAFADHAAVVWVTVAGCAGRTRGVIQDFPP
jgi:hypothetical protein